MNIIGFNYAKILAGRSLTFKAPYTIDTNIEFISIEKEKNELLKDAEILPTQFKFSLTYYETDEKAKDKRGQKQGEVVFEGTLLLSATKDESKDLLKSWKKKEIPQHLRQPLFNTILRKCTLRALSLQEELNLPSHINLPLLEFKKQ